MPPEKAKVQITTEVRIGKSEAAAGRDGCRLPKLLYTEKTKKYSLLKLQVERRRDARSGSGAPAGGNQSCPCALVITSPGTGCEDMRADSNRVSRDANSVSISRL